MEGVIFLDGVSREKLPEEVTVACFFKRNKNETHAPFTTYTGEPIYQYYFMVLLSNISHIELGSLLFHCINLSP